MAKGVSAKDINLFISIKDFQKLSKEGKLYAKIRYGAKSEKIKIIKISNKNIRARFLRSQRAITPGQSLVFYNNAERLLGGGVICK